MIDQLRKKHSTNNPIHFILRGDPSYMGFIRFNGSINAECKKNRLRDTITIKNLFESNIIQKPIELDITFFFPLPHRPNHSFWGKKSTDYYTDWPQISHAIKYIEELLKNIAYKDSIIISKVSAQKKYDEEPRTEFYFREL